MLELYHGSSSVCSAKVRVGLAEKGLGWKSYPVNLPKGEQFKPENLAVNPNGVVPTLLHDGFKVFESSLILEYIDALSQDNPLMPTEVKQNAVTKHWLLRCLDIHSAINTMTFSTVGRAKIIASKTPEEIAVSVAKMPNPKARAKRGDIIKNGLDSTHVEADFHILKGLFSDMQAALEDNTWMNGKQYSMTDVALIAYIDRLDRLSMAGLWKDQYPNVQRWLEASKKRPSYETEINTYTSSEDAIAMKAKGAELWPEVEAKWLSFLNT